MTLTTRRIFRNLAVGVPLTVALLLVQHMKYTKQRSYDSPDQAVNISSSLLSLSTDAVPVLPFEKDQPRALVILTYQRSGSSYFGELFDNNPDVFYLFEPLDALYSAFYGTSPGWNVPSDITNHLNGTQRVLPDQEVAAVSSYLRALLSCDIDALPTEMLIHKFIYSMYQKDAEYNKCIKKPAMRSLVAQCLSLAPKVFCGGRFGNASEERMAECNGMLNSASYRKQRTDLLPTFQKYLSCRQSLRKTLDRNCTSFLKKECESRSLRVVKLVRGTMRSIDGLLQSLPNVRVLQLIRDPRAVIMSRIRFDASGLGTFSFINGYAYVAARESRMLCNTILRDVKLRPELQRKHPGKIYHVIYEDLVHNLQSIAKNIYRFLETKDPTETEWWKKRIVAKSGNISVSTSTKWKKSLTFQENQKILINCEDLFNVINFRWPV